VTRVSRRLLGLDVGERRIGVAVSEGRIAVPLTIIDHTNRGADIERVLSLAEQQETAAIVVGVPIHASGSEGEQARLTRRFGEQLAARTALQVVYQDELLSTVDARAAASPSPKHKGRVDDHAAAVILQRYLDSQEQA
jgi:putative Holliday junction resolvase